MKKVIFYSFLVGFSALLFVSCDKVDNPYGDIITYDLDTTLYPGSWQDYLDNDYPVFSTNTNSDVNVLIEDFTGHTCSNCPTAADIAHDIQSNHPSRVYVASIHAGPGGMTGFQFASSQGKFTRNFTNDDGLAYGKEFESGFNFLGNPSGTVNRRVVDNKMFDAYGTWETRTLNIMSDNNLKVNIQSVFNYYSETNGGYLHVEVEKKSNDPIQMNTVVYVIEKEHVNWQKMPDNSDNEFYTHQNIHLGSIDNRAWGQGTFSADDSNGAKKTLDYSYTLPSGYDKDDLHFLIYVYDVDTYEILQVIQQEIN